MFLFDGFSWVLLCLEMDGTQLGKKKTSEGNGLGILQGGPLFINGVMGPL